jgi:hypothetical protein
VLKQRSSRNRRVRPTAASSASTTAATILLLHNSLHNLPSSIKHNIHQRIQRRIRISLLRQPIPNTLRNSSLRHVLCEIANNGTHTSDFLNDVAEIVDEEVEGAAALGDGAEQAVDGTDDVGDGVADELGCVADGGDEEGV